MQVYYGVPNRWTTVDLSRCKIDKCYKIPAGDINRSKLFQSDPIFGVVKTIKIHLESTNTDVEVNVDEECLFDETGILLKNEMPEKVLSRLHQKLKLIGGSMSDEYPEQVMAAMFIKPSSKVLEIGGNIGRNSLIIASLLKESSNLVVLECDPITAKLLEVNRDTNDLKFAIEPAALSKRSLYQSGWQTIPSDVDIPGWKKIQTLTYSQLKEKYSHLGTFDTLVLDCEGAFYWILKDEPNILDGVTTIIVENDYASVEQYQFVVDTLTRNDFILRSN
jgi:FkbM family methyltransferase